MNTARPDTPTPASAQAPSAQPSVAGLRRGASDAQSPPPTDVPLPSRPFFTRVGLPVGLVLAFLLLLAYAGRHALSPRVDVRVVPVVALAGGGSVGGDAGGGDAGGASVAAVVAQAAGWVEPDPFPVFASALSDGVVEEVLVLEGEHVEAGQVVARLVAEDAELALAGAEARFMDSEAHLSIAEAVLTEAQSEWSNPVERDRAVDVAEAELEGAKASVRELDASVVVQDARIAVLVDRLAREEREVEDGASSEFAVSQTRLLLDGAKAERERLLAHRAVLTSRERAAKAERDAARRDRELRIPETRALAEAKAQVRRAKSERDGARSARDESKLRLDRMVITAPVDGVVMRRLAAPGAKLMLGMDSPHSAHVVHLYNPQKLQVRVDVPLADAAGVGVGQDAEIIVEVLPDRTFSGAVTRVVHEADIQKNTMQVKVAITDPVAEILPEMLARVRFLGSGRSGDGDGSGSGVAGAEGGGRASRSVYVPEELLVGRTGDSAAVFLLDKGESEALRRDVKIGRGKRDGWVEVVSGVAPGDSVIDGRGHELEDGMAVRVTAVGDAR